MASLQEGLVTHAADKLDKKEIENILSTYHRSGSLTLGKLQVVLDRFNRAIASRTETAAEVSSVKALPRPRRYEARQSSILRPIRTIFQRMHVKTGERREIDRYFREKGAAAARKQNRSSRDEAVAFEHSRIFISKGKQGEGNILHRALREIESASLEQAQGSMPNGQRELRTTPVALIGKEPLDAIDYQITRRYQIIEAENNTPFAGYPDHKDYEIPDEDKTGLFTIPIAFKGDAHSLINEDHVVNLTIDFDNEKLLYLDSKAKPLEDLGKAYKSIGDLTGALDTLGKRYFGENWNKENGIVQLQCAKQLGANDCAPFVVEFSARLQRGESVSSIDRDFSPADRAKLRVNAARLLKQSFEKEASQPQKQVRLTASTGSESESGGTLRARTLSDWSGSFDDEDERLVSVSVSFSDTQSNISS